VIHGLLSSAACIKDAALHYDMHQALPAFQFINCLANHLHRPKPNSGHLCQQTPATTSAAAAAAAVILLQATC
jgi:hypothetical protein